MTQSRAGHEHPSPHRRKISTAALLFGMAAGPAAWAVQQVLAYGVSSQACFPTDMPAAAKPEAWAADLAVMAAAGLAFLLLALVGAGICLSAWRTTREEKEGRWRALLEVGEGRSRFLALCGVLAGALFCLAIVFDLAVTLSLRACGTLGA